MNQKDEILERICKEAIRLYEIVNDKLLSPSKTKKPYRYKKKKPGKKE